MKINNLSVHQRAIYRIIYANAIASRGVAPVPSVPCGKATERGGKTDRPGLRVDHDVVRHSHPASGRSRSGPQWPRRARRLRPGRSATPPARSAPDRLRAALPYVAPRFALHLNSGGGGPPPRMASPQSNTLVTASARLQSIPARSTAQRGGARRSRRHAERRSPRGTPVFSWAVHPRVNAFACATRAPSVTGHNATPRPSTAPVTWAVHAP